MPIFFHRKTALAAMALEAGGAFLSAELLARARRMGARFVELARLGWKVRRFRPMV